MMLAWNLFRSLRPRQWLKNLSVFIALFLGGWLFAHPHVERVALTFVVFCAASSSMYLLNDVIDRRKDQLHPTKKNRPIASGQVPAWLALLASLGLVAGSLGLAMQLHITLVAMVAGYLVLQVAYSLLFKQAMIIDAMLISLGFIIRVYAGAFVIQEPLSAWLLLAVGAGAWFLALGKRRSELTLMGHRVASEHRSTLLHYPEVLLDSLTTMAATTTIVFYSLFAFLTEQHSLGNYSNLLPSTLESPKLLMLSIPLVVYGAARYLYIIYEKREADSPEFALLRDFPLLAAISLLALLMYTIIYILPQGAPIA
jgi:4-hydroxybenzoate polyprenyltransferase